MSWLTRLFSKQARTGTTHKKRNIPEGLWSTCQSCKAVRYRVELERNLYVCPKCDFHEQIPARSRLEWFFDEDSFEPFECDAKWVDHLKFRDSQRYKDRISAAQKRTGEEEALVIGQGSLYGRCVIAAAFEFSFMGGSMGRVVGERFVEATKQALAFQAPMICFSASGGARMQEGLLSLLQMAKTSVGVAQLAERKIPFISVLTHPTMGGVSASLAMLGDVIVAEPKALIGFAGPRVIEQTVRQVLPEGFQKSEFLLEHGHIDTIVDRRQMREKIYSLLKKLYPSDKQMCLENMAKN